ncbi:hypothetical protein ABVP48_001938 [Clostridium perfringens]
MNKIVREAKEKDQFNQWIPDVEVGDEVELREVWDGNGETPDCSVSYLISREDNVDQWINYEFEIVEEKEEELETVVKITNIEFI